MDNVNPPTNPSKNRPGEALPENRSDNLKGIFLGFPFDQLLNQECPYLVLERTQNWEEEANKLSGEGRPGIVLPDGGSPGSGNIVICGPPGSGKSTLALQFAVECASRHENGAIPAYFSLETTTSDIRSKAKPFGWCSYLKEVKHLHSADEFATADDLARTLRRVLKQPDNCPFTTDGKPDPNFCENHCCRIREPRASLELPVRVLLTSLSPRPLAGDKAKDTIFLTRYKQIERFLSAASSLRQSCKMAWRQKNPREWEKCPNFRWILPLAVMDSLNMLAMRPLQRDELLMLFSLFRQHETIGVFVVESTLDTPFDSTIADVVISLDMPDDIGYVVRHMKVDKSRYQNQVYGWHPFRTIPFRDPKPFLDPKRRTPPIPRKKSPDARGEQRANEIPRRGIVVFPSLHYVVLRSGERLRSGETQETDNPWKNAGDHWGINAFKSVLPDNLQKGSVIAIEGPKGTFKINLAMTFLAKGLSNGESGLLIRLHDRPVLDKDNTPNWPILSEEVERNIPPTFSVGDITGLARFVGKLRWQRDPVSHYLMTRFKQQRGWSDNKLTKDKVQLERMLVGQLNKVVRARSSIYDRDRFEKINLDQKTRDLLDSHPIDEELARLNRLLLEAAYPRILLNFAKESFWRRLTLVEGPSQKALENRGTAGQEAVKWQHLVDQKKAVISVWDAAKVVQPGGNSQPWLFEVDFKSGALLPEELVQVVWDIIIRRREEGKSIERVVLADVSEIGAAYPFLRKSSTSGDFFLPAMAHVMRNHQIDFVVTGSTGALPEGDEAVGRIRAVADTVVSTRHLDVFGKRHIIVQGEGLTAHADPASTEPSRSVPPIIQEVFVGENNERHVFKVDAEYLEGLVGFETANVHRPGVSLHLFEEHEEIHKCYNREIELMLRAAFADEASERTGDDNDKQGCGKLSVPAVTVLPFSSWESLAMHDSLQVFEKGEPINETVICNVDEFVAAENKKRFVVPSLEKFKDIEPSIVTHAADNLWPYYGNVLLLAYRTDARVGKKKKERLSLGLKPESWTDLHDIVDKVELDDLWLDTFPIRQQFWFDRSAPETLSCALIDALKTGAGIKGTKDDISAFDQILGKWKETEEAKGDSMAGQLAALHLLCHKTPWEEEPAYGTKKFREWMLLPDDAAVYLCWYTQLRQLIERRPGLAKKLTVCALPAKGFRGDWYVGIVKGSVSPALGQNILKMLCRKQEQYKRFARWGGLPVNADFQKAEFNAWPRAEVKLARVLEIHNEADLRSKIDQYGKIRLRLYNMAKQLTPLVGPPLEKSNGEEVRDQIRRIVLNRLSEQLEVLKGT